MNSVKILLSQINLLRWLTFKLWFLTVTNNPGLLDLFISYDTRFCSTVAFLPLRNSDVIVLNSIDFPSSLKFFILFKVLSSAS